MSDPIDTGMSQLKDYGQLKKPPKSAQKDLKSLNTGELLALRDEIDALLPPLSLKTLNAEQELLLQYLRVKELQTEVAGDDGTPTNQKAQVANSVANTLREITRLRNEIYNGEQFRLMEAALARALRSLPAETQQVFYTAYKKAAEDMATVAQELD